MERFFTIPNAKILLTFILVISLVLIILLAEDGASSRHYDCSWTGAERVEDYLSGYMSNHSGFKIFLTVGTLTFGTLGAAIGLYSLFATSAALLLVGAGGQIVASTTGVVLVFTTILEPQIDAAYANGLSMFYFWSMRNYGGRGEYISKLTCWPETRTLWYFELLLMFLLTIAVTLGSFCLRKLLAAMENSGTPISVQDLFITLYEYLWNIVQYGQAGVISTSNFVRNNLLSRTVVVVARLPNDTHFRELNLSGGNKTMAALMYEIEEVFHVRPEDVESIIKNDSVIVERDADVSRLVSTDKLVIQVRAIRTTDEIPRADMTPFPSNSKSDTSRLLPVDEL